VTELAPAYEKGTPFVVWHGIQGEVNKTEGDNRLAGGQYLQLGCDVAHDGLPESIA